MDLPDRLRRALIGLGQPASAETFVTDEELRQLASQGFVDYEPATGAVRFTELGRQIHRDLTGIWTTRNI